VARPAATHSACDNPCAEPAGDSYEFGSTPDPTMIMGYGVKRSQALLAVAAMLFF
jgi:hypothetical protein